MAYQHRAIHVEYSEEKILLIFFLQNIQREWHCIA